MPRTASADEFVAALPTLEKVLRAAIKGGASLASHRFYAPKARAALAQVRKTFSLLKRDYPEERFPRVAFQLATMEPLVARLVEWFPSQPRDMLRLTSELAFKVEA